AGDRAAPGSLARDVRNLFLAPTLLFQELPRGNRAGAALLLLLVLHALYGLAVVSTGVTDYEVARGTQQQINGVPDPRPGAEDAEGLRQTVTALEKGGVFARLVARVLLVVGGPLRLLVHVAVLVGILFVVLALAGGVKPEFRLLAGVVVFAAFVQVPRCLPRRRLLTAIPPGPG